MPPQATIAGAVKTVAARSFYGMLAEADRAQLHSWGIVQTCVPGSELMLEGDPAASVTILGRGWAKSAFTAAAGTEVVLRIYGPGDLFGSEAILQGQRYPETVTALVPCRFLTLPGFSFAELLLENRDIASTFRQVMGWRALAAEEQLKSRFRSPSGRLARVLLDLAARHGVEAPDGITIPVELSQEELAGLIGVSRSTAARVLRNLRLRGIVHTGYRRITVTALKPLQAIAESAG
jgi:CRP/FNR family cyclic AMP-dependent transcriptional regulator